MVLPRKILKTQVYIQMMENIFKKFMILLDYEKFKITK